MAAGVDDDQQRRPRRRRRRRSFDLHRHRPFPMPPLQTLPNKKKITTRRPHLDASTPSPSVIYATPSSGRCEKLYDLEVWEASSYFGTLDLYFFFHLRNETAPLNKLLLLTRKHLQTRSIATGFVDLFANQIRWNDISCPPPRPCPDGPITQHLRRASTVGGIRTTATNSAFRNRWPSGHSRDPVAAAVMPPNGSPVRVRNKKKITQKVSVS